MLDTAGWLVAIGLGFVWLGVQVIVTGRLPRQLRRGEVPTAKPGTPEAFGLFWLDQYGYIGLVFIAIGLLLAGWGLL